MPAMPPTATELVPCIGAARCANRGLTHRANEMDAPMTSLEVPQRLWGGEAKGLGGGRIAQSLRRSHRPKHSGRRNYRVISGGLRPTGASTTTLSKSMSIFPSTIGLRDSISEGAYHGCFSTTPF